MALRRCLHGSLRNGLSGLENSLYASVYNGQSERAFFWRNRTSSELTTKRFCSADVKSSVKDHPEKLVMYRAKWMRPLRVMVRLKIFQLGVAAVTAVVGGAGAASTALWYYSRRYVGEMALVGPNLKHVQLSVVDFWGNREDNKYELKAIIPPLKGLSNSELEEAANQVLIPLDVIGARQFFLSLRHGRLIEKELLLSLLHGNLDYEKLKSLVDSKQALEKKIPSRV